ncbi:hypothetical protein LTR05_001092 [Lithohypha guttulata]|uniref:Uncharacterized protein n=1 Tax=Lithohypha guttulata TaxID=1690604 RepID=A0AAN7TD58_9EURO|nr:hypothetical protein LTR05_001092 [Lithohypha guttulata]
MHVLLERDQKERNWMIIVGIAGAFAVIAGLGVLTIWYRHRKHKHINDIHRRRSAVLDTVAGMGKGKYAKLDDEEEMSIVKQSVPPKSPVRSYITAHGVRPRSQSRSRSSSRSTSSSNIPTTEQLAIPYADLGESTDSTKLYHADWEQVEQWEAEQQAALDPTGSKTHESQFFSDHYIPDEQELRLSVPEPALPRPYDAYEQRGRSWTPHDGLTRGSSCSPASQVMSRKASMLQSRSRGTSPSGLWQDVTNLLQKKG